MYGKIFNDIFGSTVAEFGGDTMYVLMCMVVLSDAGGYIRMTPTALARTIRKNVDVVKSALTNLEAEDPDSSTPDYKGRRIIKMSELTQGQENRGWLIVNKRKYSKLKSQEDRDVGNSERQQRYRDKKKESKQGSKEGQNVTDRYASLHHVDVDVDVDVIKPIGQKNNFDLFWSAYPRKVKKRESLTVWKQKKLDSKSQVLITDVKNRLQNDDAWKNGFIPHPTTYLRGERWNDEIEVRTKEPEMKSRSQILRVGAQKKLKPQIGETMEAYEARVRMTRE